MQNELIAMMAQQRIRELRTAIAAARGLEVDNRTPVNGHRRPAWTEPIALRPLARLKAEPRHADVPLACNVDCGPDRSC